MKVLRFLLIFVLILVVGYLVLCAVSDKELNANRSTTINAPASVVWEQVLYLKNHHNWSPWAEMDSTMTETFEGVDGQAGSKMHYKGKIAGEGIMENVGVNGMTMKYAMHFITPFKAEATGDLIVSEENGATKATQTYHQVLPFFMRGFFGLMGGQKMMEKNFDRGLELLKAYSEAHATGGTAVNIQNVQFGGGKYAVVRKTIGWGDMKKYFEETYGMLGANAGARITGTPMALYYKWDEANQQADVAAGFPVSGTEAVNGATLVDIPASAAYMVEYTGGYTGSGAVHEAIGKHMEANKKEMNVVMEEYVVGPPKELDSNKFVTKIYYLVK